MIQKKFNRTLDSITLFPNLTRKGFFMNLGYEKIYFFIMMIYLGMANGYTQVLCYPPSQGLWTFFIPIALTMILIVRNIKAFNNNRSFWMIFFIVLVWIFLLVLKYHHFYAMNMFLMYNFCLAYVIIKIYGKYAMKLYDDDITILCAISIIVWALYNAMPSDMISFFDNYFIKSEGTALANAFVVGLADSKDVLGYRNLGFAQEPGFFSCFIILGMFFNLLVHKFKVRNKNFIIQFLALITTQSTTGYSSFLIIILLIIFNGRVSRIVTIIVTAVLLPTILTLPFMTEKIIQYKSNNNSVDNVVENGIYAEKNGAGVFVPQRFDGFALEWMNFVHDPILGYGVKGEETSYVNTQLSSMIYCSNGNIKVFSRFGLIFGVLFFYILFQSSLYICDGKKKNAWLFILMYMLISMSYDISTIPLLLSFWFMFPFFKGQYKYEKNKK
jgi:hypothetical protein